MNNNYENETPEEYTERIHKLKTELLLYMRDTMKLSSDDAFALIGAVMGIMIIASTKKREIAYAMCNEYMNALKKVIDEFYDDKEADKEQQDRYIQ